MRILLVDDDPNIIDGLLDILEDAGYAVLSAQSCAEGRTHLESRPDVVILDFNLPDGQGADFAKEIRGRLPKAQILLMTGMCVADLSSAPNVTDVDALLTKPVPIPELLALIKNHRP
jgi:DNA-binding response OmpR family regulator